jgi:hypothetical protein
MDTENQKIINSFRKRYEKEYDLFISIGVTINNNLLFVNSAIIAGLIATNKIPQIKYSVLLFFLSTFFSLLSLYFQTKLSRNSAIIFLTAAVESENAIEEERLPNLPSTDEIRKDSGRVAFLLNSALLAFFAASALTLYSLFCT